ncbi:MAG: glutaredoxin family protein [Caldimonas sp.]
MTSRFRSFSRSRLLPLAAFVAAVLLAGPSLAQFKVVGADGKITYTDREPSGTEGRVITLGARAPLAPSEPDLPFELRQTAAKYPVTLYTASGTCEACASARQLLKARGIPYSERHVVSSEDADALERLSGAREAPTLAIGSQTLRGLAGEVWHSYLDAAGYPRESRLPQSYQYRPAVPIVERKETSAARPAATATSAQRPAVPLPAGSGGIRF